MLKTAVLAAFLWQWGFLQGALPEAVSANLNTQPESVENQEKQSEQNLNEKEYSELGKRTITMYTSRPEETDATPCIGASGIDQCELWKSGQNICASNEFRIGTVIEIENLGECVIMDRMNARYTRNVDWYNGYDDECLNGYRSGDYCPQLQKAKEFAAQFRSVRLVKAK